MEHNLRVLVRIDTKTSSACIEVRGCLVPENCGDLVGILRHTALLGADLIVNLSRASHLDALALDELLARADEVPSRPVAGGHTTVAVQLPEQLPTCLPPAPAPARPLPLDNKLAFELAFLQRSGKVFRRPG
ncbi:hypothetical protein ITX31_11375 [Arthrobacter gandavensis]|uniref:hypothetical protein n=1 Tax=Arthrobacter gandavensis TaxID=169960 RepID=UPI00188FA6F7|nr:hypothetical protein [Arthrobacter gandavensis]MBF4994711.1 hypothetical protein [Arthrobacter gandavensis]